MKKLLPILILLFVFSNNTFSQSYNAYSAKAKKAREDRNYTAALSYYHFFVTEAGRESLENYHYAAESARKTRVYDLAEDYYQRVANMEKGTVAHPLTEYWLADVEKRQGKYIEAKAHFEAFLAGPGSANSFYADKARKEIADCEWAMETQKEPEDIEIEHLEAPINSEMTDLAPVKRGGKLYFTSIRDNLSNTTLDKEEGSKWIQRMDNESKTIEDISLTTVLVKSDEDKKHNLVSEFNAFREDSFHVAHVAFANEGKRVVYSLCKQVNFVDTNCKLYYRDQDEKGEWSPKNVLPENINKTGYTTTQPSIGKDRTTGKNLLFFASDRPDGQGEMDIWCTYFNEDDTFDEPVNLSAVAGFSNINTTDNEITPFWDEGTQTLYFSSEGHQNMGSYDIYKVKKKGSSWGAPKNMGYPMNSSYDDVYYSVSDDGEEGFFSSNRPGSLCGSGDSICTCNDIYRVEIPVGIKLEVVTFNSITKKELTGTNVDLENIEAQYKESQFDSKDTTNYFAFDVDFENKYGVFATKDGYTNGVGDVSTMFERTDTTLKVRLELTPKVDLNTFTYNKKTGEELTGVKVDLILQPKSTIIDSEDLEITHQYNFGLDYYNTYMVVASKEGYTSDTSYVRTDNIDIVPTTLLAKLYLCKGLDPFPNISLYFDNDYPDPDTEQTTTKLTYGQTAESYLDKKNTFLKPYKRKPDSYKQVEAFFDEDVELGLEKLDAFAQRIYDYFASTDDPESQVLITIEGHASKKSNPGYNFNLTRRRVSSLRNHLRFWTNGSQSMRPYYDANRIQITDAARGDSRSITKQITPIVDLTASRERRVDIIGVRVTDQCDPGKPRTEIPKPGSPLTLRVLTFDEVTGKKLLGTTVEFSSEIDTKKSDTKSDNYIYYYDIKSQMSYNLMATKEGYSVATKVHQSGNGTKNPQEVRLYLRPNLPAPGELKLRVLTFHELTGEPLPDATVGVAAGVDNEIDVASTINNYTYLYDANWKTSYQVNATKAGYTVSRADLYTNQNMTLVDNAVEVKLYLRPAVDLTALTYDRNAGEKLTGVKVDLFLQSQNNVMDSQMEADLFKYLYKIDFKKSYMVVASKPGYTSDTTYVTTEEIPMVPTNLETKLYLCKTLDLAPNISLYFDNDHPDPDCERVTTALTYKQTCDAYLNNRRFFESKFASGSEGYGEMQSFFDKDVAGGMARLNAFAEELYNYFATADASTKISITIQGHASLRSNPRYNLALTKRRVSSLENYLRTWEKNGQKLAPYYSRISITEVPKGDREACIGCYEKSSIKDLQACKDRRVDVISAKVVGSCGAVTKRPGGQ